MTTTDSTMARRLAELLEPEPQPSIYRVQDSAKGFWERGFRGMSWHPIAFDDNAMRRVREELKRRGLQRDYLWRVSELLELPDDLSDWSDDDYYALIHAPLAVQIAAAVGVLKEAAK